LQQTQSKDNVAKASKMCDFIRKYGYLWQEQVKMEVSANMSGFQSPISPVSQQQSDQPTPPKEFPQEKDCRESLIRISN
jgi:hypothetical protein